jgi:mono/diheme cytochrome c family protein
LAFQVAWSAVGSDRAGPGKPWIAPSHAAQRKNPIATNKESLAIGRELYVRECRSCHGAKGLGDGKGGRDLDPRPTDLTNPMLWDQSDGAMFWKITEGRGDMPEHKELLNDEERWHVLNYMRTLAPRPPATDPQFDAPESYRVALSSIVNRYQDVHRRLVESDEAAAEQACGLLGTAVEEAASLDTGELSEEARTGWTADAMGIRQAAGELVGSAGDLSAARKHFGRFSAALVMALEHFGHAESAPLLVFAIDPEPSGATVWIQAYGPPQSPYGQHGAKPPEAPRKRLASRAQSRTDTAAK